MTDMDPWHRELAERAGAEPVPPLAKVYLTHSELTSIIGLIEHQADRSHGRGPTQARRTAREKFYAARRELETDQHALR